MATLNIDQIKQHAILLAEQSEGNEDFIFAQMALIPPHVMTFSAKIQDNSILFDMHHLSLKGKLIFEFFKKHLKEAICDDFNYCSKKDAVDNDLKKYLPEIIEYLLNRFPSLGNVPMWLLRIFGGLLGIEASVEAIAVVLIAWLIIKGCDALCHCS
jgi:hypothetical protein